MGNPLKKITTRAKAIRRAHPGKSWKTAVKEAGREYRTGKIPKRKVKARKAPRRRKIGYLPETGKTTKRMEVAKTRQRVGSHNKRKRTSHRKKAPAPRRRRVGQNGGGGGGGGSMNMSTLMPVVLLGGLGLLAYAILKKPAGSTPPVGSSGGGQLIPTGNAYRDQTAERILAWAAAAGMAVSAITQLIAALNRASPARVNEIADTIDSTGGLPPGVFIAGALDY